MSSLNSLFFIQSIRNSSTKCIKLLKADVECRYDNSLIEALKLLIKLGVEYLNFVSIFNHWSCNVITLYYFIFDHKRYVWKFL